MKRPFFVLGVITVFLVSVYYYSGVIIFYAFIGAVLLLFCIFSKRIGNFIFLFVFLSVLIISVIKTEKCISCAEQISGERYMDFTVCSSPEDSENARVVTVISEGNRELENGMKFNLYFRDKDLYCGEKIIANINVFSDGEIPLYMLSKQIYGNLWLNGFIDTGDRNGFYYYVGKIRNGISDLLFDKLPKNCAGLDNAMVLGDKSYLSDGFTENVRRCGVSHILVVSGLHLSIIMGFIFFIADRIFYNKYLRFLFIIILSFLISALCGFTPSVLRASLVFILFSLAPLFGRDADALNTLGCAVFLIVAFEPLIVFNISFQMSVLAFFAVIYVCPFYLDLIYKKIPVKNKLIRGIIDISFVSVTAQIFTAPVAVYNFGSISLIAPLVNVLLSFAVTVTLIFSVTGIVTAVIPVFSDIVFFIVQWGLKYFIFIVNTFGKYKFSAVNVPKILSFVFVGIIIIIMGFMYFVKGGKLWRLSEKKTL